MVKVASNIYRFMKIDKLAEKTYGILKKFELGKKAILANEFIKTTQASSLTFPHPLGSLSSSAKIIYFKGCVNEFINPKVKNATEQVLKKMGIELLPVKFDCCGVPFLSCGNAEQFRAQAIFNLSKIPDEFDYFLTDCASCQNAFEEYINYIDDEQLLKKLDEILKKSMNVSDFLSRNIQGIEFNEKTTFTFHKPCHLENMNLVSEFLKKSKNVDYIEMKDFDKCCGFAGEFAVKNPKLSTEISSKKAKNAVDTGADYILTACPSCTLGLTQGLIKNGELSKKVLNFIEFIAKADRIY